MKVSLFFSSMLGAVLISICHSPVSAQTAWHHANDLSSQNLPREGSRSLEGQLPILGGGSFRNRREFDPQQVQTGQECSDAIVQGDTFLKAGKTEAALRSFRAAMDYIPNDALALERIAETYAATGRVAEANQTYHKLFYESRWQSVGGTPSVYLGYAIILAKTGNSIDAMKFYQEGAARVNYMDGKPSLKVLLPELVEERILAEQVRYTPERLQALADTAIAHEELGFGSNKEAVAHMKEAVKLFPDSPVTHYYLGDALRVKDPAGAKVAYQKAVALGDDQTQAAVKENLGMDK